MPYTPLTPRRWNSSKFLRWRRGALFLIPLLSTLVILGALSLLGPDSHNLPRPHFLTNFLSNPAIVLAVLPSGAGVQQRLNHKHCSGPSLLALRGAKVAF